MSSRRQFLGDSALAAAMLAVGPFRNALADASDEPIMPQRKKRAGDPLPTAVVGVHAQGLQHLDAYLRNPNTEIAYIVDVDERIGRACAESVGRRQRRKPKFVRDLRRALDDRSVQLVSIAAPNHWHALAAIWSMQAGKDVYVEKPISYNLSEGRRIVEAAKKYRRICQVGTQCRSMQGVIDAIEYLKSGKLGEVRLARGLCYKRRNSIGPKGRYQPPGEVDYNLWCGPARMLPLTRRKFHYDWHWQREWGNGDMGNQASHQMDLLRWGLGLDRLADGVITFGGRLGYEDAGDVANTEVSLFDFGDKTLVFEVRGLAADPLRNVQIGAIFYGSEGYLAITSHTAAAAFDPSGRCVQQFDGVGDHFGNFVDAVQTRDPKRLRSDAIEGHLSSALCHLANMSYYLGQRASPGDIQTALAAIKTREDVNDCLDRTFAHLKANRVDLEKTPLSLGPTLRIDTQSETVVGHPDANAMLTRDGGGRAPFVVPKSGEV
ncbi:MAG: Gfo/Idh/MocA family oxidoreductase [Planctomycetaceae bacterium]|nr:Gfo/Idh/MocA family oxidoreductase [Planctomycetaceae bacterium]